MRHGHRDSDGVRPYCGLYDLLNSTYFRHQSPDYRPGEGFVAVGAAEA
jgi:hypothetical protein